MKNSVFIFMCPAFFIFTTALAASSVDLSKYSPSTFEAAYSKAFANKNATWTIEAGNYKYKVQTTFSGNHRETSPKIRELIQNWVKALGHQPILAKFFDNEVEVFAKDKSYWLPIQDSLVESFSKEVKTGAKVDLYIMYLGALGKEKVFIINEFQAH